MTPIKLNHRSTCRLCRSDNLELILALTPTPPANAFVTKDKLSESQETFPLNVHFCHTCGHVQLLDIVNPELLFYDYVYVSSTSPIFVDHFRRYAEDIMVRYPPEPGSLVLDIGSNDGTLLSFFQKKGMAVLGVDPAKSIAEEAISNGIETRIGFFGQAVADEILATKGPASVVTANNVFAHADDLDSITRAVKSLLAPDGIFVFEVSYLADVIEKTLFDTIYHEHLSYHSVEPLRQFFERHDMEMIGVGREDTHGGSLRGICQLAGGPHADNGSVEVFISKEHEAGLNEAAVFKSFSDGIDAVKRDLNAVLAKLKLEGKTIAGYGAPAKATTLMYHFGLGPDIIDFIVDDSPLKQGLYLPGMHIPVVPSSEIGIRNPDFLIILAWNFSGAIIANNQKFKEKGGRFIVPLPDLEIL